MVRVQLLPQGGLPKTKSNSRPGQYQGVAPHQFHPGVPAAYLVLATARARGLVHAQDLRLGPVAGGPQQEFPPRRPGR